MLNLNSYILSFNLLHLLVVADHSLAAAGAYFGVFMAVRGTIIYKLQPSKEIILLLPRAEPH